MATSSPHAPRRAEEMATVGPGSDNSAGSHGFPSRCLLDDWGGWVRCVSLLWAGTWVLLAGDSRAGGEGGFGSLGKNDSCLGWRVSLKQLLLLSACHLLIDSMASSTLQSFLYIQTASPTTFNPQKDGGFVPGFIALPQHSENDTDSFTHSSLYATFIELLLYARHQG